MITISRAFTACKKKYVIEMTQVKGQHKYQNDCLKKSNICVEEHPSVSKHLSYLICEDVHERVHE